MYFVWIPFSSKKSVRSSAIFLVSVVTSTRAPPLMIVSASAIKSLTCPGYSPLPVTGRTSISGSTSPVGRITCSTICPHFPSALSFSYWPGVADINIICPTRASNSSKLSGRLSTALGRRNPCSTSVFFRDWSPAYIAPSCGMVTCDSSISVRKSGFPSAVWGKYERSVYGASPGARPSKCRE